MAVKFATPTREQLEAIQIFLQMDSSEAAGALMKSLAHGAGYLLDYDRPLPLTTLETFKMLSMAPPGQAGLQRVWILPHAASGLTLKITRPHVEGRHPIDICLHALEDFDAVVREVAEQYSDTVMTDLIARLGHLLDSQAVLDCINKTLADSDLGGLFHAARSAAVLADAIEPCPDRPARSFIARR